MAAALRLVSVTKAPASSAVRPDLKVIEPAPPAPWEPPPANRAAARGYGTYLGLAIGLPTALGMHGLIYLSVRALGGF